MIIYEHCVGYRIINDKLTKGITLAIKFDDNMSVYENLYKNYINSDLNLKMKLGIGMSICSEKDQYSRKLGRLLSASRTQDQMIEIERITVDSYFVTFVLTSENFSLKIRFLKTFLGTPRIIFALFQ